MGAEGGLPGVQVPAVKLTFTPDTGVGWDGADRAGLQVYTGLSFVPGGGRVEVAGLGDRVEVQQTRISGAEYSRVRWRTRHLRLRAFHLRWRR